jgi:hypothetical protein
MDQPRVKNINSEVLGGNLNSGDFLVGDHFPKVVV